VPIVLLVRHGRTTANTAGVLAGANPDVILDEVGLSRARVLAARLAPIPLARTVSGPLGRCLETADILMAGRPTPPIDVDDRLTECDYGTWTGRTLRELSRERLWRVVQSHPAGVTFPGGEAMRAAQARAVEAIRDHDAQVAEVAGPHALWLAVSHGDVIKSVVADALGLHLDLVQRLIIDPGSVTAVRYTQLRPFLMRLNDTGGDLSDLRPRGRRRGSTAADAEVGGGAGRS